MSHSSSNEKRCLLLCQTRCCVLVGSSALKQPVGMEGIIRGGLESVASLEVLQKHGRQGKRGDRDAAGGTAGNTK